MNSSTAQSTFLGTNLNSINDWSTQYPFLDYFKSSRDWITHTERTWNTGEGDKLQLDDDGWVTSLEGGQFTSVGTLIPNDHQGRRFVVLYEGEGTIKYLDGARKDNAASKPGRDVFYAKPDSSLILRITETDPSGTGDYLRDIRIVPEEYEAMEGSQTFNPDFLKSLEGYNTLRFMDWMETNNSDQSRWGNRPEVGDADYFGEGVPVEVMVELANETGIDPWFTLPHDATDDYVRNFAQYVKQNLDPDLKVYVEFSNEVWNGQFEQARYIVEQGRNTFSSGSDFEKGLLWFGKRTGEITQIWDDVFGGDKERVVGVLGAQAANSFTAKKSLEALSGTGKSYQELGIDAVAIAPYFGGYIGNPQYQAQVESWTRDADGGLGKLFKELTEGGVLSNGPKGGALEQSRQWMNRYAELSNETNLEIVAYEGGQHLVGHRGVENNQAITDLFVGANNDPRMGQLYKDYFQDWQDITGDGAFANFSDVGRAGKFGSWGIRESIYQESTPKFDAIQDIIEENSETISRPQVSQPTPSVDNSGSDADVSEEAVDSGEDSGSQTPDTTSDPVTETPDAGNSADTPDGQAEQPGADAGPPVPSVEAETPDADPDTSDMEVEMPDIDADSGAEGGQSPTMSEGGNGGMSPTVNSGDAIRIEAEDMTLEGYRIENNGNVSGNELISFLGGARDERGTASQVFDGPSGTYDVVVSYVDETDGAAKLTAKLNGETLDDWQLSENLGHATINKDNQVQRTVATDVALEAGDMLELLGEEHLNEHARVDYVEFIPKGEAVESGQSEEAEEQPGADAGPPVPSVEAETPDGGSNTPDMEVEMPDIDADSGAEGGQSPTMSEGGNGGMSPTVNSGDAIRIEAEDMTLEGYRIENNGNVSGNELISFLGGARDERGAASQVFDGPSGTYDVVVSYVDETDGAAKLTAKLNGETLDDWQLSENLGHATINKDNQVQRTVATDVALEAGDTLELLGEEHLNEHARVDYVEFVPKGGASESDAESAEPSGDGGAVGGSAVELPIEQPTPVQVLQKPLSLSGNTLRAISLDYEITPDTVMQLEFRGGAEGAIQAIGFDQDVFVSESDRQNMFKLSGMEDWAVAEDLSDQITSGSWQTLEIAVGQHVTGDYDYLSLLNIDGGQADVTGEFRNVKLYEASMGAMTSEQGSMPFDDTAMGESPLAAMVTGEDTAGM
ncbi:MAG: hypothetical protein ACFB4J_08185 [Elainellaceae cyanobacterium]